MKWSSRSLGSRFQHGVFRIIVRLKWIAVARALLCAVVFYYTLMPSVRRRCLPYLGRRFPDAGGFALFLHAFRLYRSFAEILLDRMIAGAGGELHVTSDPGAEAILRGAVAEGRGCLIVNAHVGAWQTGIAGLESFGRTVHILQYVSDEDVDKHYFEHRPGHDVRIVNSREGAGAFASLAAGLRRGEIVCLMGDRLTDEDTLTVRVPFLGGTIRVPGMPYVLASITGVPLVMAFTLRLAGRTRGVFARRVDIPPGIRRRPEALEPYARMFMNELEALVRAHPYQFFNFYDMWLVNDE